jgi:mono/diheme cytochrome c family protein
MRRFLLVLLIVAVVGSVAFYLLTLPQLIPPGTWLPRTPDIANGENQFHAGGCVACHATPDQPDRTRLGGGLALKSIYGTFYPTNISSDPTDGIGAWSETDFVTAMRKGTSPDGRHYYPAFPYAFYQRMALDDLRDLFAYLTTLPAVAGTTPDHELRFPANLRRGIGLWKLLFLDGAPFKPDPSRSAQWNRGAYLVNGPAHCGQCHSPRNVLAAVIESQRFAGGPDPSGRGWIPNITQKALGSWTEQDFIRLLEIGETPDDQVSGEMAEVVRGTARLPAADRAAMAVYLKSLPPVDGPQPPARQ